MVSLTAMCKKTNMQVKEKDRVKEKVEKRGRRIYVISKYSAGEKTLCVPYAYIEM